MEDKDQGHPGSLPGNDQNSNVIENGSTVANTASNNDKFYDSVEGGTDSQGYLLPQDGNATQAKDKSLPGLGATGKEKTKEELKKGSIHSIYQELNLSSKDDQQSGKEGDKDSMYFPLMNQKDEESIYDEVETVIPGPEMCGAKIIPVEQPQSAYDEVIVNGGRYMIPSSVWETDSDAMESDFDDEDVTNTTYFGDHLDHLYENIEGRKIVSPLPQTMSFSDDAAAHNCDEKPVKPGLQQALRSCLPFSRSPKNNQCADGNAIFYTTITDEGSSVYVDANNLGSVQPVMPPLRITLSVDEAARYSTVNKILETEATYIDSLNQLVQIKEDVQLRNLVDADKLGVIFLGLQDILDCHEMFSMALATRMNEWTVSDKLGDIICASFAKTTALMAYTDFVNNFSVAIDLYRNVCKSNTVFAQYLHAKETNAKPKFAFHDLMLKPFERFPKCISLVQDLLEVTPVGHPDRVPLQLALTYLECLAETINLRRRETEMKHQVKCLDSQVSQLNKPLSSSGRLFIRQDDMTHCLIDGVSVVGTKKLRLVLLSDMLLCLSPISKKKNIVAGLLNTPKYKYKLKWNVPLLDVHLVEYGAGVSVAAGNYGTVTTYTDEGKYRQATVEIQKHIENLEHDLAVIGHIAGLASSLRGEHELLDNHKVQKWYKTVENTINEELRAINMFWLEVSLPTKSGQQSYVFNLASPTVKQEWESATRTAKLALETRNNPGWYLPDDDVTGGLSILRRNMPLLDEFFDIFVFNSRSRVEQTLTYPVHYSATPTSMACSGGLGHDIWFSARGELQGNVTVLRLDRGSATPRFLESFMVCPGTVYCMARIPAMNNRPDQTPDKYKSKYGFPFPTIWLGSHSSRIYVFNASDEDRTSPLMEIKLRDAPLDMKFTKKKIYVGLANGTLAIFRPNANDVWNFVQPSILPLGRYPVAVITDVKDKLWCGSGSQIYVVTKKGDRIQCIIAVDSNMKNLVKHIVSYGVGVWVSVWRKATLKLYHAETCDMTQEVNIVSPVTKMKNDVDSQVQYLAVDKLNVTALMVIPGFLWVGTNLGLVLLYPIPKLQGVPRVIGRACVAFHAHCGPVRSLFAVADGPDPEHQHGYPDDDAMSVATDNSEDVGRELDLADSEESVESDEEFCFVDDTKPKRKVPTLKLRNLKVSLKKSKKETKMEQEARTESRVAAEIPDVSKLRVDDFVRMIENFGGFSDSEKNVDDRAKVRSFKNLLYPAHHSHEDLRNVGRSSAGISSAGRDKDTSTEEQNGKIVPEGSTSVDDKRMMDDQTPVAEEAEVPVPDLDGGTTADSGTVPDKDTPAEEQNNEPVPGGSTSVDGKDLMDQGAEVPVPDPDGGTRADSDTVPDTIAQERLPVGDDPPVGVESAMVESKGRKKMVKPPRAKDVGRGVLSPGTDAGGCSDEDAHIYENVSPVEKPGHEEYVPPVSRISEDSTRVNVPTEDVPKDDRITTDYLPMGSPGINGVPEDKLRSSQEAYMTVLPEDGLTTLPISLESGAEMLLSQSTKLNARMTSYVVVSVGEGHVDLRMKVKSKSEIKKDTQTKLLIWRVNNKA